MRKILFITTLLFLIPIPTFADEPAEVDVRLSPKEGWETLPSPEQYERSTISQVLWWLPNRVMDLIDIFKVDVGVGPAFGAVGRVTKYGQVGYRQMLPLSARAGLMGRRLPVAIENSSEIGAGPLFAQSDDREVCPGEIGLGADLLIAGAYGGVCVDELADFVAGIFLIDFKGDDY